MDRLTLRERVDAKWVPEPNTGCWLWTASMGSNGYGQFAIRKNGKSTPHRAHRVVYELHVGPIPDGLDLDHLCRVKSCVNPAHLEPVTRRENLLRGNTIVAALARQTHCKRGHPLNGKNLVPSKTGRQCRACVRLRQNSAYRAKVAKEIS